MFNALRYTQELERVGFTKEQAEMTMNLIHQFAENGLATKEDILVLKHSIETLEHKMTIKMGTMLALAVGLLVALQKLI